MSSVESSNRSLSKWRRSMGAAILCVLSGTAPALVFGQSQPLLLRAPACTACRIEVARLFTLDDGPDKANSLEDWPFSVAMDSHGRIALAIRGGKGLAVLYDSLGRSPRRIGRFGSGPNEYRGPVTVAFDAGDTLNVFDLDLARRTQLIGNAQLVRSTPYIGRSALLRMLPNNDVLAVSGTRFYLYSQAGSLIRHWGQAFAPATPGGTRLPTRYISNVVANQFWSVNSETYELEHWSLNGTRLAHVKRVADWFDSSQPFSNGMRGEEPSAFVADLHLDRDARRLWVLLNVPSKNWRNGLGPVDTKRGFTSYPNADFGLMYESFVEVIDVGTRKLLQSTRVPAYLQFFVSDSRLAALRHSEDGSPVVELWRVGFKPIP